MAIKVVGVVGCGLMGSGIAQVCAEAGYQVLVREVDEGFLKKGLAKIEAFLAKGVEKGKVTPERKAEVMVRLKGTTDLARMGEWSPECTGVKWAGAAPGPGGPSVGAVFKGKNKIGIRRWSWPTPTRLGGAD